MIISNKQIINLMTGLHEAIKIISLCRFVHPEIGKQFLEESANLLNQINRQQSNELKTIE